MWVRVGLAGSRGRIEQGAERSLGIRRLSAGEVAGGRAGWNLARALLLFSHRCVGSHIEGDECAI
jgi:hypothetical protein